MLNVLKRAADWQLAHPPSDGVTNWRQAVFADGLLALAEITFDQRYYQAMRDFGNTAGWKPGPDAGVEEVGSDDYAIVYMYAKMFVLDQKDQMLAPSISLGQSLTQQPYSQPLLSGNRDTGLDAAIADSLFMGPPALVALTSATGDPRYVDLANEMFWRTKDYIYDPNEHLFYRDMHFFGSRESNGQKMFWSRGNGWVVGSMARMMQDLPAQYPDRGRYEEFFREMVDRIVSLQSADGYWRSSLLNPDSTPNPESSGTALFTFALLWGLNNGVLAGQRYIDAAQRGWSALTAAVHPDGMLGWVQPQAGMPEPNSTSDSTGIYGTGALLLAGSEMYRFATHEQIAG